MEKKISKSALHFTDMEKMSLRHVMSMNNQSITVIKNHLIEILVYSQGNSQRENHSLIYLEQ